MALKLHRPLSVFLDPNPTAQTCDRFIGQSWGYSIGENTPDEAALATSTSGGRMCSRRVAAVTHRTGLLRTRAVKSQLTLCPSADRGPSCVYYGRPFGHNTCALFAERPCLLFSRRSRRHRCPRVTGSQGMRLGIGLINMRGVYMCPD